MATTQQPFEPAFKLDAERAWAVPVGVASPMWFAFGVAAATATSWWWMTRWARELALDGAAASAAAGDIPVIIPEKQTLAAATDAAEAAVSEASLVIDPVLEAPVAIVATAASEVETVADDLTRLVGVGPKLAAQLAQRGVTRFAQIAAWQGKDLDDIDKALSLKGRAVREAWVSQARRLAAS